VEDFMPRPEAIEDFKQRLRGSLLAPADPNYDVARRVWNGMIDKRPALIAAVQRDQRRGRVH
jgi:hypothetical protein